MITNIHLHPSQQARLKEIDIQQLEKDILSRFPYPLAISYRNLLQAAKSGNKLSVLTTFAYDVTTSVFQFLSLVLASDYHENRKENSLKIYNAIADMSYRPGPGKWLEFMKMYPGYLKENSESQCAFNEIVSLIEMNSGGKKRPMLKIEENYGSAPAKQAGLLEFMVMFRNNLAHTKGYSEKDLTNQVAFIVALSNYLFSELSFLMHYRLVVKSEDIAAPLYLTGDSLATLPSLDISDNLFLEKESHLLKLFPLIISDRPAKSRPEDIFLLESVDNDRVFFSGNRIMSEKLKGRDEMANKVFDFLQSIYAEPKILDLTQVAWNQFRNRCLDYSKQVISDYALNNKYNDAVYILPEAYREITDGFWESGKQIVFLTAGQGSGKSALCAHLTHEFICRGNSNEASLLIDARLLDELGDEHDVFLQFIKKKLGVQGDLPEFLRKMQEEKNNPKITLIIDNMNEYFSKERDQSFLLEQLFDTVTGLTGLNNIQIIVIARPEYYQKSFEKYAQSFIDFVADVTYMPGKTAATPLPALDENETEQIWNNYQQKYTGYSPRTNWTDLNDSVRKSCINPMIMLFLLKRYDNETIPGNLTIEKIKKQYIRGILKNKKLKKTLFDLIKKMHKEQKPYLLTESFAREEFAKLFDSTKEKNTNLPRNHAYTSLVEMQILREERVEKEGKSGKKISVNNEMTLDVITSEYKLNGIKQKVKLAGTTNIGILLVLAFSLFIFLVLKDNKINDNYQIEVNDYLVFCNTSLAHSVISDFANSDYQNRALSIFKILFIVSLAFCLFMILLLYDILDLFIFSYSIKKTENKISFYNYLSSILAGRRFYRIIIPKLIFFLFVVIAIGLILIALSASTDYFKKHYIYFEYLFIYLIIFVIIGMFTLFGIYLYKFILNDEAVVLSSIRESYSKEIKKLTILIIFVTVLITFCFMTFNKIINLQYDYLEKFYLARIERNIDELTLAGDQNQLKELAAYLNETYSHVPEHPLKHLSQLLSKSLNNEPLRLIPVESSFFNTLTELKKLSHYSFSGIWPYLLFSPLALILMAALAVKVPLLLVGKSIKKSKDLRII